MRAGSSLYTLEDVGKETADGIGLVLMVIVAPSGDRLVLTSLVPKGEQREMIRTFMKAQRQYIKSVPVHKL